MAVTVSHFRFGVDELAESTHGWIAAEDTNPAQGDVAVDTTFLLRFKIQCTGGSSQANCSPVWQYRKNGGTWTALTTTSSNAKTVDPAAWNNAASTTARLTGSGAFDTSNQGCTADGTAGGAQMDIAADGNNETECGLQIVGADVTGGDVIDFRILNDTAAFDSYPATQAGVTVAAAVEQLSGTSPAATWTATPLSLVAGSVALAGTSPATTWTAAAIDLAPTGVALSGTSPNTSWLATTLDLSVSEVALSGASAVSSWTVATINLVAGEIALSGPSPATTWAVPTLDLTVPLSGTSPGLTWTVPTLDLVPGSAALVGDTPSLSWSVAALALAPSSVALSGTAAALTWSLPTLALELPGGGGGSFPVLLGLMASS